MMLLLASVYAQNSDSPGLHPCGFTIIQFPGAQNTTATGINNAGTIVGSYVDNNFNVHGFILANNQFQSIDMPSGVNTSLRSINNRGQILGSVDGTSANPNPQSFILENGTFTLLNFPGTPSNFITAFNDRDEFTGTDESGPLQGFVISGGQRTNLPDFNGSKFFPASLNDRGVITGNVDQQNAALLRFGQFTTIQAPGASATSAQGINNLNEVVGTVVHSDSSQEAYFYSNGSFTIFNFQGAFFTAAQAVNDQRQIVGSNSVGFFDFQSWVTQLCTQ
jgi:uncharacterized membrane protein